MAQLKTSNEHLYQLIESISSGVSALTEDELNFIGEEINGFLRKSIEFFHPAVLRNWTEFIETGLDSDMLRSIALRIEPDLFFHFGKILNKQFKVEAEDEQLKQSVYHYLNIFRQSGFLKNVYNQSTWDQLIYELINHSNYHLGILFTQRLKEYGQKTLFNVIKGDKLTKFSWTDVSKTVREYSLSIEFIANNHGKEQFKIAFLMENSPEMAFLDLACLTSGFINVMIPANSVPQHIEFILNQTKASLIFISNDKQLAKIKTVRKKLKHLKLIVILRGSSIESDVITFNQFKKYQSNLDEKTQIGKEIKINQLATIMYTSGTTGDPKGIMFSQMNLVYKRFCRAMALPEIGSHDRFLSYLPLYHTFGRYLEMLGTVFWGAEYNFMENPARDTMLENMQLVNPTVFISIPKKWSELYQVISSKADLEFDDQAKINRVVEKVTGGSLKWGLSAAGYLDPEVFIFFQKNGIELMSGFGMTEATGGITMTPPGRYKENSLGRPLPGIEAKLADDGEMLIRGQYVMIDYYDGDDKVSKDNKKWLATGDIMRQDADGFYEIIDRKKEIYKNIKGETIAPQKIENYFRDFEYVDQVFLVGDHRPYNTVLIYYGQKNRQLAETELNDYFSTVVVTVNNFLAPFERIIDFRLTERPFSDKFGELTAKGTYKRRVIEKNFDSLINQMYERTFISLTWKNLELKIPNWFLREKGCLTNDIKTSDYGLEIPKYNNKLLFKSETRNGNTEVKVGSYFYTNIKKKLDFQTFLANPLYWLGNREIIEFAGESIYQWYRLDDLDKNIGFASIDAYSKPDEKEVQRLQAILSGSEYSLEGLHLAILFIQAENEDLVLLGFQYLDYILSDASLPLYDLTCLIIQRPHLMLKATYRKAFMLIGLPHIKIENFKEYFTNFLLADNEIIDASIIEAIIKTAKDSAYLESVGQILKFFIHKISPQDDLNTTPISSLFNLLAQYGINHPTRYKIIRQLIVRYQLYTDMPAVANEARKARIQLLKGFRNWLGENQKVAVDVETGEEYQWVDVISFEEGVSEKDRSKIIEAISETCLVREAIFLLSGGNMIRLYDIPPGGMWISLVDKNLKKSIFRLSLVTRYQGSYDISLSLHDDSDARRLRNEVNWLIHMGRIIDGEKLLQDFGGFWPEYSIWTKEFSADRAIYYFIERKLRRVSEEDNKRLYFLWPFIIWSATWANLQFWKRTNYQFELQDKSAENVIVPTHDYQTGIRIVSIEKRLKSKGLSHLLIDFYKKFVLKQEKKFSILKQPDIWFYIFSAVLESEGEEKGIGLLKEIQKEEINDRVFKKSLDNYIEKFYQSGYLSKKLFFAIRRFNRWKQINQDSALSAQARMLNELYDTYFLSDLEKIYPDTRAIFFLHTVFVDSNEEIKNNILMMSKNYDSDLSKENILTQISHIQQKVDLTEKEIFFLTRLSYPYLKPTDSAEMISFATGQQPVDVVIRLEDYDGKHYMVRRPVTPKEISRLHQIFLDSQLKVNFRPEHKFLVAISERGNIIGGLFYNYIDQKTAYMEKIVVSDRYRRKGISEGLMHEFFNRLRSEHVEAVTTGFFRPEYFYRFGFKVERKYSGLVKDLIN